MSNLNPDDGFSKNALNFVPSGIEDDRLKMENITASEIKLEDITGGLTPEGERRAKQHNTLEEAMAYNNIDREPKLLPSDPWAPAEPEPNMRGDHIDEHRVADTIAANREKVLAKLEALGQALLDVAFELNEFEQSDMFKRMTAIADGPEDASDEEIKALFEDLRQSEGGIGGMATFIIRSMELSSRQVAAAKSYFDYRRMAQDMGLV